MTKNTQKQFETIKQFLTSEESPVEFLNTLNDAERNALRPLVFEEINNEKYRGSPLRDSNIGTEQIWYTFLLPEHEDLLPEYDYADITRRASKLEVVEALIDYYRPLWLEERLSIPYLHRMRYFKAGYLKTPFYRDPKDGRLNLDDLINAPNHYQNGVKYYEDIKHPTDFLYKHEELYKDHIWYLFTEISQIEERDGWIPLFHELIEKGKITRAQVFEAIADYTPFKEYPTEQVTRWVFQLLKSLKPTVEELQLIEPNFAPCILTHQDVVVKGQSIDFLKKIASKKKINSKGIKKVIEEIDFEVINLSFTKKYLGLFAAILKKDSSYGQPIAKTLSGAKKNVSKKIRDTVTKFIADHGLKGSTKSDVNDSEVSTEGISKDQVSQISNLLMSINDANTKIALSILENSTFPKELLTEVFLVHHTTTDPDLKKSTEGFILDNASEAVLKIHKKSRKGIDFDPYSLKSTITKLVKGNELDGVKMAKALFNKSGVGVSYLLEEANDEEQRELLKKFITGTALKINGASLRKFPEVIFSFPKLTEIDLADNDIKSIPPKITSFKDLKILNFSDNQLDKLNKVLKKCQGLEELYLAGNLFEHPFPDVLYELVNLKKLDISANQEYIVEGEDRFQNFKQLTEFKMENTNRAMRNMKTNRIPTKDIYDNYPTIDIIVKGDPLNMEPLAIAKTAFEQGNVSGNGFLLSNGDVNIQTAVLKSLYNQKTMTLDLSNVTASRVPESLSKFNIKNLIGENSDLAFKAMNENPEYFPILETVYFKRTVFDQAPDFTNFETLKEIDLTLTKTTEILGLSSLKKLKILNARYCDLTEIVDLKSLESLEELNLERNKLKHFPKEVFELTNLKVLKLSDSMDDDTKVPKKPYDGLKKLGKLEFLSISGENLKEEEIQKLLPKDCALEVD